jgi:hypothetical protein
MASLVFFSHGRIDALLEPIQSSARVKYTALAVSSQHVALGANTGAVYCFDRREFKLRRLLANKEGCISLLSFSPGGRLLALTVQKSVVVWDHNVDGRAKPRRVKNVDGGSKDGIVTAITWDDRGGKLFAGDDKGNVKLMNVSKSKIESRIQMKDSDIIYRADSPIVQMDHHRGRILVSTRTQCHILELHPIKCIVTTVGTKPRDGIYGGCLSDSGRVYSARPGSRIWEADIDGHVKSTHQLKSLLAVPPAVVWGAQSDKGSIQTDKVWEPQSLSFHDLHLIRQQLLMWQSDAVYVFDPMSVQLLGWTNQFHDILGISSIENELFLLHDSAKSISQLALLSPQEAARLLFCNEKYRECAQLIFKYPSSIKSAAARWFLTLDMLSQLKDKLLESHFKEESDHISSVISQSENKSEENEMNAGFYRQSSGIFVVRQGPETQLSKPVSLPPLATSSMKRPQSAPGSLSLLSTDSDLGNMDQSLHSSISEEGIKMKRDSTAYSFSNDTDQSLQDTDISDGRQLEPDDDMSDQIIESAPPSISYSFNEPSYLTGEAIKELKGEVESNAGDAITDGDEVGGVAMEERSEEILKDDGDNSEEMGNVEVPFPEVESNEHQPRIQKLVSLVQWTKNTGSSNFGDEDSIATSLPAVKRMTTKKEKRKKKKKLVNGRSVDFSNVPSDKLETISLDPSFLMHSPNPDENTSLPQSTEHSEVSSLGSKVQSPVNSPTGLSPSPSPSIHSMQAGGSNQSLSGHLGGSELDQSMTDMSEKPVLTDSGVVGDDVGAHDDSIKDDDAFLSAALRQLVYQTRQTLKTLQELDIAYSVEALQLTLNEWRNLLNSHSTNECNTKQTESVHCPLSVCQYWKNTLKKMRPSLIEALSLLSAQVFEVCICGTHETCEGSKTLEAVEFIQQYFPILNIERVRQAMVNSGCYTYDCWCVLVQDGPDIETTDITTLSDYIRHSCLPDQQGNLLPLLSKLYALDGWSAVQLCIELYPGVQPVEVAFLCRVMPRNQECQRQFGLYLRYLNELTDEASAIATRHHSLQQISQDQMIIELWFEAALTNSPPIDNLFTADKQPNVGSHQLHWPEESVLRQILDSSKFQYVPERLLCLCQQFGYWIGCIELMCQLNKRQSAVEILYQLGDVDLIRTRQKWGDLPLSINEWKQLLTLMTSNSYLDSLNRSLTWDNIVVTLVERLGAAQACHVLSQVKLPPHSLPDGFMHLVYRCSRSEKEQRSACRSLLEKYDSYLWSPKVTALSSHFQHLLDSEKQGKQKRHTLISLPSTVDGRTRVLEDGAFHWGMKIQQDRSDCPVSTLPLSEQASSGSGASQLIAFDSGHIYHESAVPEQACIMTFSKRFHRIQESGTEWA